MPGSVIHGKKQIKAWVDGKEGIERIVDVGAGSCTYPKLLGDRYRYTAIEIWAPYIKQFNYDEYYDEIIVADVEYVRWPDGDLVILGDVIEHLVKGNALMVLERALQTYPHTVLSIPFGGMESEEHYGNWYETHRSNWEYEEVLGLADWELSLHFGKKNLGVFAI